jgi:hypothetical protein
MRLARIAIPLLAAAFWVGCGGRHEPVGQLTVSPQEVELGYPGAAEMHFAFRFDHPLEGVHGDLRVFVHLLDTSGKIVRTFDHDLPVPWRPGSSHEYSVVIFQSALAPPLAAGVYRLTAGLHDGAGSRWPLSTAAQRVGPDEYAVATVATQESLAGAPMFLFPDIWQAAEGGTDRQVLARRWLGGTGSLRLAGLKHPGTLWVSIGIPTGESSTEQLVMDEGATVPAVDVSTECGGFAARIEGTGSHAFSIPIGPGSDGQLPAECEVTFATNYYLVSVETLARKTIALENLAWSEK